MELSREIERQFKKIDKRFSEQQMEEFCQCHFSKLSAYHFGLGLWIRNNLLHPESKLYQLFCQCGVSEQDDMSMIIIEQFYLYQHGKKGRK